MPFLLPKTGTASGARDGTTGLFGSLAPVFGPTQTRLGANMIAYPPYGAIRTSVSASFVAGVASPGMSLLTVIVAGRATTCRAFTCALGGHSQARAELSLVVSEFDLTKPLGQGQTKGARLSRIVGFNPTVLYDDRGYVLGYNLHISDGSPFSTVAGMRVVPGRSYEVMINLSQFALCEGVTGAAVASSNVAFDFPAVFFSFA
jgi:hypothetical protein